MTRREFVRKSAGSLVAAGAVGALSACATTAHNSDALLPIIDTHQHLWDLDRFNVTWMATEAPPINRTLAISEYMQAIKGLNVVKAVYMEVGVAQNEKVAEAEYVIELSKNPDNPTVAGVIHGDLLSPRFQAYIDRFKNSPYIKGIRHALHGSARGLCLQDRFVQNVRLLGEMNMSFDLILRPSELADGVKLADKCPDTRIILDHCGNGDPKAFMPAARWQGQQPWHEPDQWLCDISELAKRPNVICKVSGIVVRAPKNDWGPADLAPLIDHCLDEFGPDRVVFASDWPVCTLVASFRQWVAALKEVIRARPIADQRKLLHDNAMRLYSLS